MGKAILFNIVVKVPEFLEEIKNIQVMVVGESIQTEIENELPQNKNKKQDIDQW